MVERTPFGEWLRKRRHLLNLTQAALAAESNCSVVTIRKLEAGDRRPSLSLAQALTTSLRIPKREHSAFIQFARSDEYDANFRLPAWEPDDPTWRTGQAPTHGPVQAAQPEGALVHYELVAPQRPQYEQVPDGRYIALSQATGPVRGDIEGVMDLALTQIIMPKPVNIDYSQSLPMQIGAFFTIRSGEDTIKGVYTGSVIPMTDAVGNGTARVQATGQIVAVTARFIDLFLNYVFIEDVVRMVEGTGTGSNGTMQLRSSV